jgi:hypothetical protein
MLIPAERPKREIVDSMDGNSIGRVCVVMLAGLAIGAPQTGGPKNSPGDAKPTKVTVVSAKRADKWSATSTELTPKSSADVVLVVDIAGVSIDEFRRLHNTARAKIFLSAGDERYDPSFFVSGAWGEPDGSLTEERMILVIVPRGAPAFVLHYADSPPVRFTVSAAIAPKLP